MFVFPVDPGELLRERTAQFTGSGIPAAVLARVTATVDEMWGDGPTSWLPVWSREAEAAEAAGRHLTAALCWGAARFPALAAPGRVAAQERQVAAYLTASARFPVRFTRTVLDVGYRGGRTAVPVHLFQRRSAFRHTPRAVLLFLGGVDTWKMDLHRLAVASALTTGYLVAAVDMPGTGESAVPLATDADEILAGVADRLREIHDCPVGALGISFGGHWTAKLALLGRVDAAVDIGGPTGIGVRTADDLLAMPCGMPGIVGNALGLDAPPTEADALRMLGGFDLAAQGLLAAPGAPPPSGAAPLLAVNGADDPYIPREDVAGLATRAGATVWILRDAGHCAPERFRVMMPAVWTWLRSRLTPTAATRLAEEAYRLPLRPLLLGG